MSEPNPNPNPNPNQDGGGATSAGWRYGMMHSGCDSIGHQSGSVRAKRASLSTHARAAPGAWLDMSSTTREARCSKRRRAALSFFAPQASSVGRDAKPAENLVQG